MSGTDYTSSPAVLTIVIPASTLFARESFQLTPVDDLVAEGDETIVVSGTAASGTTMLAVKPATLQIGDDDKRGVTVSEELLEIQEGDQATYTVVLDSMPSGTATVTVAVSSEDAAAAAVSPASLVFDGTDWSVAKTVTVEGVADMDSLMETVVVSHLVSGADYEGETAASVRVEVFDGEQPPSRVDLTLSPAELREGSGQAAVEVTGRLDGNALGTETAVSVTFGGGTASPSDYRAQPGRFTLIIPPGSVEATATVTVTPVDDGEDEFDETVRVMGSTGGRAAGVERVADHRGRRHARGDGVADRAGGGRAAAGDVHGGAGQRADRVGDGGAVGGGGGDGAAAGVAGVAGVHGAGLRCEDGDGVGARRRR